MYFYVHIFPPEILEHVLRMPSRQMQPHGVERHSEGDAEVLQTARNGRDRLQDGGDHEEAPLRCSRCGQL